MRGDPLTYGVSGLVGLGLALWKFVRGAWSAPTSLIAAILLVAAMLTILRTLRGRENVASTARLVLRTHGDERPPAKVQLQNVYSWHWLRDVDTSSELQDRAGRILLVFAFDFPLVPRTLEVHSPDVVLPSYEVKEFNSRLVVVAFEGEVPAGILDIHAHG